MTCPLASAGCPRACKTPTAYLRRRPLERQTQPAFHAVRQRHHEPEKGDRRQAPQRHPPPAEQPHHADDPEQDRPAVDGLGREVEACAEDLRGDAQRKRHEPQPRQSAREKGDSPHLCAAPSGPFRQMGTVPFFASAAPTRKVVAPGPKKINRQRRDEESVRVIGLAVPRRHQVGQRRPICPNERDRQKQPGRASVHKLAFIDGLAVGVVNSVKWSSTAGHCGVDKQARRVLSPGDVFSLFRPSCTLGTRLARPH